MNLELLAEIDRLRSALLRVARFSHAKDFSHHGADFEDCDRQSCVEARADLRPVLAAQALKDGWVYEEASGCKSPRQA
jgi:hypothetical protein